MSKKESIDFFNSYDKIVKLFFGIAVLLLLLFGIFGQVFAPDERDILNTNCKEYNPSWTRVFEDGSKESVTAPTIVEAAYGEKVTLTTTLPDNIENGTNICFRPVWQDVDIYIDGELRLSYNTKDSRPFGTNSSMKYIFVELTKEDSCKEFTYVFSSNSKYAGDIRTGYIGDRLSIWIHLLQENGLHTFVALFLLMMSLFCIIICFILKYLYKKELPLNYLAWTLFFCAFWMISEMSFRQIIYRNISILSYFTYWSLMIIPLPLITFINDLQKGRYKKVFLIPQVYTMCIMIVGTLLQVFDIVQFVEQLKFIHGGLLVSIVCIIATITIDTFTHQLGDYLFVGIGIYGMIVTAILEMVLYYVGTDLSLGTTLSIGLLFLLVMAIIKTGQDLVISEKKKQQAITAREAQAKFLANMSHEIRTPINTIIGMNEMILRENKDMDIEDYSKNIQSASNMLLGLINDILDFSKIESGQLELVEDNYHLPSLIHDEMIFLENKSAEKPITTHVEIDPNLPTTLYGDELRIKQILTNLLSNATKYTASGYITLRAFYNRMENDTVNLCFSVADSGMGIKKEDLSQLFNSFKRLELNKNRTIEGSGLGLNITKQLVDLMGGDIKIDSEYGKGSTFTVIIPQKVVDKQPITNLYTAIKKVSNTASPKASTYTAPNARVLVVDDNSMNLTLMDALLKRTKMSVDLAASGKGCLELTKSNTYDIIFMDHMMPELDGIETLKLLRAETDNPNKDAIVIALTANAVAGCKEMYLENGFNDYLSKPVIASVLDEMIIKYLPDELINIDESVAMASSTPEIIEPKEGEKNMEQELSLEHYLEIDKSIGMGFCMDDEDFYKEILSTFISQSTNFISQLEEYFKSSDWGNYAIIAHSLKSNTRTIGAENFAELSLKHELAGKSGDGAFITESYEHFTTVLKALVNKVQGMI